MPEKVSEQEALRRLDGGLSAWALVEDQLYRCYETADWRVTLMTANAVGFLADAAHHHPRMVLNYRSVELFLTTYDAGGVTDLDFDLARKIEDTVHWQKASPDSSDAPGRDRLRG